MVTVSVYGTDNRCTYDALQRLQGKGRGVAFIDPDTITDDELDKLHSVGFRAVRVYMRAVSKNASQTEWPTVLRKYAARIRRLGWAIQIYISLAQVGEVFPLVPELGVKIVFDHLAHPEAGISPSLQPGCEELYKGLKENKNVFVKLSGTYRLTRVPDLESHIKHLLKIAPDQVVWGSDWPHTGSVEKNPGGDRKALQDYLTPDIPAFIQQCIEWCENDVTLMKKIWVDNPRRLWDYTSDD